MTVVKSEMAGTVLEIKTGVGTQVTAGAEVAIMESMKMEVPILAPVAGKVTKVVKQVGEFANAGDTLLEIS